MPNKNDDRYHDRNQNSRNNSRNQTSRNNPRNNEEMDTFREGFSKNIVNKLDDEKTPKIKIHNYTDKYSNDNNSDMNKQNLKELGQTFFEEDTEHLYEEKATKADKFFLRNIIFMVCIVGLSVAVILLSFSLKATKDELSMANSELSDLLDTQKDAERKLAEEAMQSENESLKAELDSLKDPDDTSSSNNSTNNSSDNSTVATTSATTTSAPSNNTLGGTSYTVQASDSSIWDISKKLYGNGAYFQKILDANGLKDGDILKEGQVLVIPEL